MTEQLYNFTIHIGSIVRITKLNDQSYGQFGIVDRCEKDNQGMNIYSVSIFNDHTNAKSTTKKEYHQYDIVDMHEHPDEIANFERLHEMKVMFETLNTLGNFQNTELGHDIEEKLSKEFPGSELKGEMINVAKSKLLDSQQTMTDKFNYESYYGTEAKVLEGLLQRTDTITEMITASSEDVNIVELVQNDVDLTTEGMGENQKRKLFKRRTIMFLRLAQESIQSLVKIEGRRDIIKMQAEMAKTLTEGYKHLGATIVDSVEIEGKNEEESNPSGSDADEESNADRDSEHGVEDTVPETVQEPPQEESEDAEEESEESDETSESDPIADTVDNTRKKRPSEINYAELNAALKKFTPQIPDNVKDYYAKRQKKDASYMPPPYTADLDAKQKAFMRMIFLMGIGSYGVVTKARKVVREENLPNVMQYIAFTESQIVPFDQIAEILRYSWVSHLKAAGERDTSDLLQKACSLFSSLPRALIGLFNPFLMFGVYRVERLYVTGIPTMSGVLKDVEETIKLFKDIKVNKLLEIPRNIYAYLPEYRPTKMFCRASYNLDTRNRTAHEVPVEWDFNHPDMKGYDTVNDTTITSSKMDFRYHDGITNVTSITPTHTKKKAHVLREPQAAVAYKEASGDSESEDKPKRKTSAIKARKRKGGSIDERKPAASVKVRKFSEDNRSAFEHAVHSPEAFATPPSKSPRAKSKVARMTPPSPEMSVTTTQNIPQIPQISINLQDIEKMYSMFKLIQSQQSQIDTSMLAQVTTPMIRTDRIEEVARDEEEESPRGRGSGKKSKGDKTKKRDK